MARYPAGSEPPKEPPSTIPVDTGPTEPPKEQPSPPPTAAAPAEPPKEPNGPPVATSEPIAASSTATMRPFDAPQAPYEGANVSATSADGSGAIEATTPAPQAPGPPSNNSAP